MKADPADLAKLLDVQGLDTALEQAKHKAAGLPVHQAIAALLQQRNEAMDNLIAAKTQLSDVTAAAGRAEADVVPVQERLKRNQARVDAGEMDAKALSSALDEIAHLKQRVSDLEDVELEALDRVDQAKATVAELTQTAAAIDQDLRTQVAARDAAVAELAAQAEQLTQERAQLANALPADLLGLYEKIRGRGNGVGVARLEGRRCAGCGLEATVTDHNRYTTAAPDDLIRCAECDRILVR